MAAAGRPTGTAAEFTVVPAEQAVPLPDEAGIDVGASLGVPALTAHRTLTVPEDGPRRLRPGALDPAAGGAGAVGHAVDRPGRRRHRRGGGARHEPRARPGRAAHARHDLERTADAHRAVESGAVGKVLVDVRW